MGIDPRTMRLFVAVELPELIKQKLARIQERIRKSFPDCPARWVAAVNIHLSLNFLGDVNTSRLEGLKRTMEQTAEDTSGFDLNMSGVGAFPNLERPRVIWVGLHGDLHRLMTLHKRLEWAIFALGISLDTKPFSPHLTIARVPNEPIAIDKNRLEEAVGEIFCGTDYLIPVRSVSLIRSQLTPSGPIYSVLKSTSLL